MRCDAIEARNSTVKPVTDPIVPTVQFHIPEWDDPASFAIDFTNIEQLYGRTPSQIDIDRAYARYKKLAIQEEDKDG